MSDNTIKKISIIAIVDIIMFLALLPVIKQIINSAESLNPVEVMLFGFIVMILILGNILPFLDKS